MPRTKSKNHRHTVVSNDPTTKATAVAGSDDARSVSQLLRLLEARLDKHIDDIRNHKRDGVTVSEITAVRSSLETKVLPKLRSLESTLQPINRLPKDIFVLIPRFFTREKGERPYAHFPMNRPLITMTHVCRSWRNVLLSTPSLWTQVDFSQSPKSLQAKGFISRSGEEPLDIHQHFEQEEHVEPFLSITLRNMPRVRRLDIHSYLPYLENLLGYLSVPAPILEYLDITNEPSQTERDIVLPKVFGGRFPKLTSLSLHHLRTDLRGFNPPSLTRFSFATSTNTSIRNLTSFLERCPLLEFIRLRFYFTPEAPDLPPKKRVCLAALKELEFDQMASTSGLLDYLILPKCMEMKLKGEFTGEEFNDYNERAARIHPSSIDHLPVMRGITKAVAMRNSCVLSGPNGYLRLFFFEGTRDNFDAKFFTSLSPISVLEITELWVGQKTTYYRRPWGQTSAGVRDALGVLMKVEDLNVVNCEMAPFFSALGVTSDGGIILPRLRRLTIYIGRDDLDVLALIQCAKARKERYRPFGVTLVFEEKLGADLVERVESLRAFVGELVYRVVCAPKFDLW